MNHGALLPRSPCRASYQWLCPLHSLPLHGRDLQWMTTSGSG